MNEDLYQKGVEYANKLSRLYQLPVTLVDPPHGALLFCTETPEKHFCAECRCERCNKLSPYLYGSSEAFRWNGRYIYYCPTGLTFISAAILDESLGLAGALTAGPFVMGEAQDTYDELASLGQLALIKALPVLSTGAANDYSALLCAVATQISGVLNTQRKGSMVDESRVLNSIYDASALHSSGSELVYQLQCEQQLRDMVLSQDKKGAQDTLNELLGYIYFSCDFDLDRIRIRVTELLVLLSRASIDAGANIQQVFLSNTEYLHQISGINTLEALSAWLTGVLHYFIDYTFDYPSIKHTDVVYKCMDYIRQQYNQKITLDDIAVQVSLSRSYLSKLFKAETGYSLFSYINHIRVEKAKQLLRDNTISLVDIAGLCGFEDQSYFTKVFRKEVGVSPKKYRDKPITKHT